MNYLLIPTLLIGSTLFAAGMWAGRRTERFGFSSLCILGLALAFPGVLFATYYLKILGEPISLYQFRSAQYLLYPLGNEPDLL